MTLYTTHCPLCETLKRRLDAEQIHYEISENMDEIIEMGFNTAPILKTDDSQFLSFHEAMNYIRQLRKETL